MELTPKQRPAILSSWFSPRSGGRSLESWDSHWESQGGKSSTVATRRQPRTMVGCGGGGCLDRTSKLNLSNLQGSIWGASWS